MRYLPFVAVVLMIILLYRTVWRKRESDNQEMAVGFYSVLMGHACLFLFFLLSGLASSGRGWYGGSTLSRLPMFIGLLSLTQLSYAIPALVIALFQRRPGVAKGILIGAGITFLLSFFICASLSCVPMAFKK